MVTEITNNTDKDVSFCVPNIATILGEKGNPPLTLTAKAKSVTYSRSVTGNADLEKYLTSNGCTLKRVRRSYIVIVAGQSNAVGYDESPHKPSDYVPVPFAYYEQLYPTTRSGYGNAGQVPFHGPYADCFQNMRNVTNSCGGIVKGVHRYIAEKLIGFVPEDYELEVWGYAYGGSGVKTGNAGTVSGANLPQNSTLWGDTGALSIATGKRLNLHLKQIQPQSKLMSIVWCLGEFDGQANVSVKDYEDGFNKTVAKIKEQLTDVKASHYLNDEYQIDTKEADGKKRPLWIVYPGPQKYWNTKGTFKQIIQWQRENFSNFVELPENLQTNNSNPTGTKKESWRAWAGYGFTSSALDSHYANCFDFIGHKVAKQIVANYTGIATTKKEPDPVVPTPTPTPTPTQGSDKLWDVEKFENVKFTLKDTKDDTAEYGDATFTINGTGNPNRSVTPSGYYWDGSSNPLTLLNQNFNFIIKDGYVKLVAKNTEFFIYTSKTKHETKKLKASGIVIES